MPNAVAVDACIGQREITEPHLSPAGDAIVFATSQAGMSSLWHQRLSPGGAPSGAAQLLPTVPSPRVGRGMGGGCWCWSADGVAVVYSGADGNLWWLTLDGTTSRQLTDHGPDRVAQAPCASADGARVVYVVDQAEVWSLALDDGATTRLDDGGADFCFDPFVMPNSRGAVWQAWNVHDMPWDHARVERVTFDGMLRDEIVSPHSVQQPRQAPDGSDVMVRDDAGWLNVWLADEPLVDEPFEHAGPTWGLGQRSFVVSPCGTWVAFTRNEHGFGRLCAVEVATRRIVEIGRGVHGQLSWIGTRLAALRTGARTPTEVVVHDMSDPAFPGSRITVAVGTTTVWDRTSIAEPETIEVGAADGGIVPARWYRADAGASPRRVICWIHGGPTDQWQVTFMPRIEFWRSRGWDIVVPDHRGSTGHGRTHQQAMNGRWGELDVADVAAVVAHLHATGVTDPKHTVLMGGSAGGFTALGVIAGMPGLVAAAALAYPVADLADLAERSHRFERHSTWRLVGEPGSSAEVDQRYRDRSPVWFADRITTPLLVFHGEDDPVVPVGQSRVLVERIRAAGGPAELVVYPGEGHGFRQPEHQRDEYTRTEAFLSLRVPPPPDHV
ncbi:MAG: prolyl oligopeptidase family serine peptidase [Ilumatobacteraceae bacterium]